MLENQSEIKALLDYYQAIGADEIYVNQPENWMNETCDFSFKAPRQSVVEVPEKIEKPQKNSPGYVFEGVESLIARLNKCLSIEDLKGFVQTIDDFSIKRTAMNMVFGCGKIDADIMLISDFPNESDDASGNAFTGPVGELARKMLSAIKIEFDDLYATYLLPWRPPGNRTPSKKEIEFFAHILKRHIALVSPKVVLFMGHAALKAVTENHQAQLNHYRGKVNEYACVFRQAPQKFYVTYNPSHLQKFPNYKKRAWEDLQFFEKEIS